MSFICFIAEVKKHFCQQYVLFSYKETSHFSCDQAAESFSPSVRLTVTPFSLCSHQCIIMKLSGVITIDRRYAKDQSQRSGSQRSKQFLSPTWQFQDRNPSFNSQMATKWCTKLEVVLNRSPVVFRDHLSNFKATWAAKIEDFDPNSASRTAIPVWIHRWLRNDAQSLKWHRRNSLSFF